MTVVTDMRCAELREALPAFLDGTDSLTIRRHLGHCPDCRAELARYEELRASLRSLEAATVAPPRGLVNALVQIPQSAGRVEQLKSHVARHRNEYLGGAAVVVAGAAGAALFRRSRRIVTA